MEKYRLSSPGMKNTIEIYVANLSVNWAILLPNVQDMSLFNYNQHILDRHNVMPVS